MNTYYSQSYPSWSHQPPFAGPPPMPSGVNVSQQQWQQGQWHFNPAYANQAQAQQALWAPAQGWYYYNQAAKQGNSVMSNPYAAQQQQQQQQQAAAAAAAQQQQQQASRNPYKRYPKPPSQEYLSYQLKENGLGLFDMVPREEVYKDKEPPSGADQTPWVWHPKRFPGEEDSGIVTAFYKDEYGNREEQFRGEVNPDHTARSASVEPRVRDRERERTRSGESDSRYREVAETDIHHGTDSAQERAWEYEGERERSKEKKHKHKKDKSSKERHRSEDPSSLSSSLSRSSSHRQDPITRHATAPISSASAYAEQQAQQAKSQAYAQAPSTTRVHFITSGTSMTSAPVAPSKSQPAAEPPPTHHPQPTQASAQEAFSSHVDLRPTFSPRIVRTPDHYRSSSVVSNSSTPTRASSSSRSASVLSSDFDRMSIGTSVTSVTPSPLTRHATAPAAFRVDNPDQANLTGASSFSEEPSSLLSPLPILQGPTRPLSRGYSAPQAGPSHPSLATIPENTPTSSTKSRSSPRRSYSPARSGGSTTESESNPSSPYDTHPRSSPTSRSSPNYMSSTNNKPLKRSPLSNPLPTPPRESQIVLQAYEGPSASEIQKMLSSASRLRKGFWSRRGCHLTKDGEIIEPPDNQSFPPELSKYPSDPAFMDHKGRITRVDDWDQRRPYQPKRYEEYIHYVS